ncbi:SDR family oxidoreductase [Streptomyces sp. NPDC001492]
MKVVVIGGTGLIGSKVVAGLGEHGHEAVAAAPSTGVNTLTGEGLAGVLQGASVVVDVSNSPSFEDEAVMEFFRTSTTNLLKAETDAGVRHHVALSVVGTDRLQGSGYFRAKQVQEDLIKASGIPFSIVHATQFFEFGKGLADGMTEGDTVRVPDAKIQPIVSDDVAAAVVRTAVGAPADGVVEVAGPEAFQLEEFIRLALAAHDDPRTVVTDPQATYWGAELTETSLLPGPDAHRAETRFADWLAQQK